MKALNDGRRANLSVEVDATQGPQAEQVFYILDRDISQLISLVTFRGFMSAADVLRTQAVKFFVTDSEGRAEVSDLHAGTYYICGAGESGRGSGVWNIKIDLKPGENTLKLNGGNMNGKQN